MSRLTSRPAPLVLAAPSGTGKTTLARRLVTEDGAFVFSVSATTRPPREGERDGVDYHFVDEAGFRAMAEGGRLVEWAEVHGQRYGTPRAELDRAAARGQTVVLDIDVQGARQIRERVPDAILVFVLPPSLEALLSRLTGRGTEARSEVARRLRTALDEIEAAGEFDYVVVNDELERCLGEIRGIVEAEAFRISRAEDFEDRVEALRSGVEAALREEYQTKNEE